MLGTPPPTMAAPLSVATLTLVLLTVAMSASGQVDTNTTGGVGGIPLNKCIKYNQPAATLSASNSLAILPRSWGGSLVGTTWWAMSTISSTGYTRQRSGPSTSAKMTIGLLALLWPWGHREISMLGSTLLRLPVLRGKRSGRTCGTQNRRSLWSCRIQRTSRWSARTGSWSPSTTGKWWTMTPGC